MVGLVLSIVAFQLRLPLSFRSLFYPIWKEKIYGKRGDIIDTAIIFICLVGVITTLSFGIRQITAGIKYVTGYSNMYTTQIVVFIFMFLITLASVTSGIKKRCTFSKQIEYQSCSYFCYCYIITWSNFIYNETIC